LVSFIEGDFEADWTLGRLNHLFQMLISRFPPGSKPSTAAYLEAEVYWRGKQLARHQSDVASPTGEAYAASRCSQAIQSTTAIANGVTTGPPQANDR
jgi:hypothetical protein